MNEKEYEIVLKEFGFTNEDKKKRLEEFSGGQQTKIAFVKMLLSKPDILLLDEPTNHLDMRTIEWLEQYLKDYKRAVVIVSHDRMLIDPEICKVRDGIDGKRATNARQNLLWLDTDMTEGDHQEGEACAKGVREVVKEKHMAEDGIIRLDGVEEESECRTDTEEGQKVAEEFVLRQNK